MPGRKHLPGATAKQQRQYEHILKSEMKQGRAKKTAKRIAAATTRKRAKNISGRVRFVSGEYKGMTGVILSIIQKRYSKEPTTYRIQIDGFPKPGGWNGKVTATENQIEPIKSNPKQSKGKAALKTTGRALKGAARGILAAGSSILGAGAKALNPKGKTKYVRWEVDAITPLYVYIRMTPDMDMQHAKADAYTALESEFNVKFPYSAIRLKGDPVILAKLPADVWNVKNAKHSGQQWAWIGKRAKALNPRKRSAAPLARWEIYKKLSGKGEDVIGIVSAQTKAQAIRAAQGMYAVAFRESSLTGRKIYIRKLGAVRFDNPFSADGLPITDRKSEGWKQASKKVKADIAKREKYEQAIIDNARRLYAQGKYTDAQIWTALWNRFGYQGDVKSGVLSLTIDRKVYRIPLAKNPKGKAKNKTIIKKAKKVIVLNKGKKAAKRNPSGSRFTDLSIGDKFRIPSFEEAVSKSLRGVTLIKISSTEARGPKKQVYNIRAQINVIKLAQNLDHKDSSHQIEVSRHWRAGGLSQWQRAHHAGQHDLFAHGIKAKPKRNPLIQPGRRYKMKADYEPTAIIEAGMRGGFKAVFIAKDGLAGQVGGFKTRAEATAWAKAQGFKVEQKTKKRNPTGSAKDSAQWEKLWRAYIKALADLDKPSKGAQSRLKWARLGKAEKAIERFDPDAYKRLILGAKNPNASRAVRISRKATAARGASSSSRKSRAAKSRKPAVKARKRKANPTAGEIRKEFAGRHTKNSTLYFPDGTPQGLAKLGKLVLIKTESGPIELINRKGEVWLCADTNKRFHLGSTINAPLIDGPAQNFGQVKVIEYYESKPHMGYEKKVIWFHHMGEEGGRRPELISNSKGELKFKGGDYRITTRGIEN